MRYYYDYWQIRRLEEENNQLRIELAKLKGNYQVYENDEHIPLKRAYAVVWKTKDSLIIRVLSSRCFDRVGYVNAYGWVLKQKIEILMFYLD